MDKKHTKQIVHSLAESYFKKNASQPNVDVSLCKICNKMTDIWSSGWSKDHKIIWMCKECREAQAKEQQAKLEQLLENMCDHH